MKYCTKCGGEIGDFAIECGHCGQKVSASPNTESPWNNNYSETESSFQSFGYEEPMDLTRSSDTGSYNYRSYNSNNSNSEASKKANKTAAVIGIVFLIIVAVAAFFIVKNIKNTGYKQETKTVEKWFNSVIDGDAETYVEQALCEPLLDALLTDSKMTRADMISQLEDGLKDLAAVMSGIQIKDIRITKKTEHEGNELDIYNEYIEEFTGKSNVINAMYDVDIEYKVKTSLSGWTKSQESLIIYKSDGKYYVLIENL